MIINNDWINWRANIVENLTEVFCMNFYSYLRRQ